LPLPDGFASLLEPPEVEAEPPEPDVRDDETLPPDEPDERLEPDPLELPELDAVSFVGFGASVTVTSATLDAAVVAGGATAVVAGATAATAGAASGARSLAAGNGPLAIERPAMAFAARPTPNAIITPAVAAAVVSRVDRRIGGKRSFSPVNGRQSRAAGAAPPGRRRPCGS
jgi:hypothetical protein